MPRLLVLGSSADILSGIASDTQQLFTSVLLLRMLGQDYIDSSVVVSSHNTLRRFIQFLTTSLFPANGSLGVNIYSISSLTSLQTIIQSVSKPRSVMAEEVNERTRLLSQSDVSLSPSVESFVKLKLQGLFPFTERLGRVGRTSQLDSVIPLAMYCRDFDLWPDQSGHRSNHCACHAPNSHRLERHRPRNAASFCFRVCSRLEFRAPGCRSLVGSLRAHLVVEYRPRPVPGLQRPVRVRP